MVPGEVVPRYCPILGKIADPPFRMVTEVLIQFLYVSILKATKVSCGHTIREDQRNHCSYINISKLLLLCVKNVKVSPVQSCLTLGISAHLHFLVEEVVRRCFHGYVACMSIYLL